MPITIYNNMKTYYAVEIWEDGRYSPAVHYRSDLYHTRERAIDAFLNLRTLELFQAIDTLLKHSYPAISIVGEYEDADALRTAYDKGTKEVVLMVNKFQDMAHAVGKSVEFDGSYLYVDIIEFTAHD